MMDRQEGVHEGGYDGADEAELIARLESQHSSINIRYWNIGDWIFAFATAVVVWILLRGFPTGTFDAWRAPVQDLPASFDGWRWLYILSLWAMTCAAFLSFSMIVECIRCLRRPYYRQRNHPMRLAVRIELHYALTIFIGFAPDAVALAVFGEQTMDARASLLMADRAFDIVAVAVFLRGFWLRARSAPVLMWQLQRPAPTFDRWPTWKMVRERVLMLVVTLVIATGVALGK